MMTKSDFNRFDVPPVDEFDEEAPTNKMEKPEWERIPTARGYVKREQSFENN